MTVASFLSSYINSLVKSIHQALRQTFPPFQIGDSQLNDILPSVSTDHKVVCNTQEQNGSQPIGNVLIVLASVIPELNGLIFTLFLLETQLFYEIED